MKRNLITTLHLFFFTLVFLTTILVQAQTQSQQEILKQYVAELQSNPVNDELREKIIKLVLDMKVKPAIPKEAIMHKGAWQFAYKEAKTESDFANAAKEYEKVLLLAPWSAEDYFNCGTTYEKAGNITEAIRQFNFYLLAAPDAKDANDVLLHLGELKYKEQQIASELKRKTEEYNQGIAELKARLQREDEARQRVMAKLQKLDLSGKWYNEDNSGLTHWELKASLDISGNPILTFYMVFDKDHKIDGVTKNLKNDRVLFWTFTLYGEDLRYFSNSSMYDVEEGVIHEDNRRIEFIRNIPERTRYILIKE